jgi:hypothetical protein
VFPTLPTSEGTNYLESWTYYSGGTNGHGKTVFDANGTYVQLSTKLKSDVTNDLNDRGEYQYDLWEEGTYSWNNTATVQTVTLKPGKVVLEDVSLNLVNSAEAKSILSKYAWTDEAEDREAGYTSKSEVIDDY